MDKINILIIGTSSSLSKKIILYLSKVDCYNIYLKKHTHKDIYDIHNNNYSLQSIKFQIVLHLSTLKKGNDSCIYTSNLMYPINILEKIKGNPSILNIDTTAYKYRNNPYSNSKKAFKDWLKINSFKSINLRIEHIYGYYPSDNITSFLITKMINNEDIDLSSGKQIRNFIYIDDAVSAIIHCIKNISYLKNNSTVNITSEDSITIKKLAKKIRLLTKTSSILNFGNIKVNKNEFKKLNLNNQTLKKLGWKQKVYLDNGLKKKSKRQKMKYPKDKYVLYLKELEKLKEIYIYGTGVSSRKLKELIEKENIDVKILGFIDSYAKSSDNNNIKVFNINDFKDLNKTVVICTYYEEWIDEIIDILAHKNINDYFINMIILDPMYQLTKSNHSILESKISFINSKLENEVDCKIWKSVVDTLLDNKNNKELFTNYYEHGHQQYLDCIKIHNNDIVIEGGVFDGITSLKIADKLTNGRLYGFDPLIANEKDELFHNSKIEIIKKALWNKNTDLYFVHNGAGSYVTEDYSKHVTSKNFTEITAVTIDTFIEDNQLNNFDFLKLDVEGAETNVLLGGIKSIKKYRPTLAISIYHSLDDFFDIPFFLMKELNNYNFNIRLYSGALMDTIIYAIPKEYSQHLKK